MGDLILVRHGETDWSKAGRHTGRTDVPLTASGEVHAAALAPALARRKIGAVFTSPASRAVRTAELAGLAGVGLRRLRGPDDGADQGRAPGLVPVAGRDHPR